MKIKYSNEVKDMEAAVRYQVLETPEGKNKFQKGWLKMQFVPAIFAFIFYLIWDWYVALGFWVFFSSLTYVIGPKLLIKAALMQQQKGLMGDPNSAFYQEKQISVAHGGITVKWGKEQGMVGWKNIKKIGKNDDFIFVFAGEEIQFILPKRVFQSPDQFEKFYGDFKKFGKNLEFINEAPAA